MKKIMKARQKEEQEKDIKEMRERKKKITKEIWKVTK